MIYRTLTSLLILLTLPLTARAAGEAPVAIRGVIDLRDYDFSGKDPVDLRGEYEFYWNRMLNPAVEGDTGEMIYVEVPGSWNSLRKDHPEISKYGFASYRLTILLPERINELAFEIEDVFSASSYFLNGKALDFLGFPGVNKYQTVIRFSRPLVTGTVNDPVVELLIRVSNFEHRFSGIVGGINMGIPDQMEEARMRDLFRGHFLMGAFLIIGIYFLGLYLIRSEQYRLYFSLICILMAMRVAMILNLPFLEDLALSGLTYTRLDFLNIYFFAPFFTLMIRSLFPYEFPNWAFRAILWISALFIAVVVVSPISLFSHTLTWFFLFFILVSAVYLYVVLLAWIRGRSHAPAFTIGLLILFGGTLNDMLTEIDVIDSAYIVHYTMFAYLLIYAYIFADKNNELQKKSESLAKEVSEIRNNLEDLVEERTTELQSMSRQLSRQKKKLESTNRELVDAINDRNRLFSIIGHDVRSPIGYIRQALDMILDNQDMSEEEKHELLKMMANSSEITYNLLDNLLVWGRSQTGKLKAVPVRFQLKSLIDESLELVNIGLRDKKLKVEVYVSEGHFVEADRDQLYIVIRNLLSNAIKFTPQGGKIYISSKRQKGDMVISVRDTGIGIPEAIQSEILEGVSQVSTGGTKGEKGSGLGLKICNDIIQTNHGWMKIVSKSGSGTTIQVGIKAVRTPSRSA